MDTICTPTKTFQLAKPDHDSHASEKSTSCHSDQEDMCHDIDCLDAPNSANSLLELSRKQTISQSNFKLKNELCRNFTNYGYCPYNDKCQFAHGAAELRQNQNHNSKYKTKKCQAFFSQGCCPYGQRCNFLHILPRKPNEQKWKAIYRNYRQLIIESTNRSRLFPQLIEEF